MKKKTPKKIRKRKKKAKVKMTHGGARRGAGRPPVVKNGRCVSGWYGEEEVKHLDSVRGKLPRAEYLRLLVHKDMQKLRLSKPAKKLKRKRRSS